MTTTPPLRVTRLRDDAHVPQRAHADDAGLDLVSCESYVLQPGHRATVGTGIAIEVPEGHAGLVCPRSGLAARNGITVVNGPGIIDAGYRGEVRVVLANMDTASDFHIEPGDRIAQLLIVPIVVQGVEVVDELARSATRGQDGFGSTGGADMTVHDMSRES